MKKSLIILLAMIMVVFAFAGCQEQSDALTIALDDTYPPMEYIDENGELVGFDVDFAKALGEEMGVEIAFVSTAWDSIFASLEAEQYDCIISSVSMKVDRLETMDFSIPYLANGQVIVVNAEKADMVKTADDLAGLNVGVQFATTADDAAQKKLEEVEFELQAFDNMTMCLAAMETGAIDAVVADMAVAIDFTAKNPGKYVISSAQLTNEPIAIAVTKGNTELVDQMNEAIKALQDNGTLAQISEDHLGGDYTQDIDTKIS